MNILELGPDQNPQLAEIKVDSQRVYQGNFLQVEKDTVRLPDGNLVTREYI